MFKKHPASYRRLFFMEGRYRMTDEFRDESEVRLELYGMSMPAWMAVFLQGR